MDIGGGKMKVLITGGNGFIGHHLVEHILRNTDWTIDIIDKLSYASFGFDRLKEIGAYNNSRVRVFTHDLTMPVIESLAREISDCDFIIHLGAETHVDNSITSPEPFIMSNVVGTMNLLQFARKCENLKKMVYFSTDEVFGPADINLYPKGFSEWDRYNSANPYAAAKAGGEELCLAWANTYKLPVLITHCMNVFGERQHSEKFIPKTINSVLNGEKIFIHSDPTKTIPGSRFWIHARNVASALFFILGKGNVRDKYNIVGESELNNLELAQIIAELVGKPLNYELVDFHSSRPGHDLRYGLNGAKLADMGFMFPKTFKESLEKTIKWTIDNPKWLNGVTK
jgi:dTDP-glucose 4,6-dehydratase